MVTLWSPGMMAGQDGAVANFLSHLCDLDPTYSSDLWSACFNKTDCSSYV